MQLLENPEISGVEYQRGMFVGCEVREYVLLNHGNCCGAADVALNLDHVIARSRGGFRPSQPSRSGSGRFIPGLPATLRPRLNNQ